MALLNAVEFEGAAEVGRRLRLSFLAATPRAAWEELTAGMRANPKNPDVRSFRGQLLERAGAVEDARIEFVAALVAAPDDPVRRDQLAEFYRRHGSPASALQTWRDGLSDSSPDFLWLRVLFWQRLWQGGEAELLEAPIGKWTALIDGMSKLPGDVFWNENVMSAADLRLMSARPEVEWLRLLEYLRQGEMRAAQLHLERLSDAAEALDPVALAVIRSVLRWQLQELTPAYGDMPVAIPGVQAHTLIDELRAWPGEGLSDETKTLMGRAEAWPALMLALGWPEAALIMADEATLAANQAVPDWLHYGMAMALRQNRDGSAALAYLNATPKVPILQLLAAEIKWTDGLTAEAAGLAQLAKTAGSVGYRAAWLLAIQALEREEWVEARTWIEGQPELGQSVTGRELAARSAFLSGDENEAAKRYGELGVDSLEAGMFLARRAFADQRWSEARELTEQLLARFPGELELRANLNKIAEAEAAVGAGEP